ncbi:MAG: hypothetical protein ACTSVM_01710 [Candidatus Ranarchaeia archaeon]
MCLRTNHRLRKFIPFLIAGFIAFLFNAIVTGSLRLMFLSIPQLRPFVFIVQTIDSLVGVFVNGIVGGIVVYETAQAYLGQKSEVSGFSVAKQRMGDLFIGSLLYSLVVVFGLILLIIPGLYFAAKYALWQPCVILESASGNGLSRSAELTQNNRWEIFWIIAIVLGLQLIFGDIGAISGLPNVGLAIIRAIVAPLTAVTGTIVYFKVQGKRGAT